MPKDAEKPAAAPAGGIDRLAINTIRTLAMDAVEAAKSGHPGTPMALAPVAYTLWNDVLRYDPADPLWPSRDRFVLSCGHASMLLYSMLHLAGVKQLVDGQADRRAGRAARRDQALPPTATAAARAIPKQFETTGVETTTGPLGQGCGNSVGMAIAQRWLAAHFNRPGFELFDYNVYALCSDGDLMEGVANEAASIAGHLKLSNLCWIYDDNHITIEGHTDAGFQRGRGHAVRGPGLARRARCADANDTGRAANGLSRRSNAPTTSPTLIIVRSHHRLRRAAQARHAQSPRRAAGRRRDSR